jgi:hypothetical protein
MAILKICRILIGSGRRPCVVATSPLFPPSPARGEGFGILSPHGKGAQESPSLDGRGKGEGDNYLNPFKRIMLV